MIRLFLASTLLALVCVAAPRRDRPTPEQTLPAINDIEPWQQVGQQPYEMTWEQREQNPHTLVDFEDLRGWRLETYGGARGELRRSREQQMWGRHVAKILYAGTGADSRVIAAPPAPIPIPGPFDGIDLWGYGNRWPWLNDETTPAVTVSILLSDARGKPFTIELTEIGWKQWWLIHRKIAAETRDAMVPPVSFAGIEISRITNAAPRYFFCDSLAFYREVLGPLRFKPQPRRNLKPYRGQIAGTNTGPGTLPFPTREETILPANRVKEFQVSVRAIRDRTFQLRYSGPDAVVTYAYEPKHGGLDEITAFVDGGAPFQPMRGGGVRFPDTPENQIAAGELIDASAGDGVVRALFRAGSRVFDYELRLWQKSLVLDVHCDGGEATGLSFGRVAGVSRPALITVPYLTYKTKYVPRPAGAPRPANPIYADYQSLNPRILMSAGRSGALFTSIWFDWYRSNASEPYVSPEPAASADGGEINGGLRYLPKTDGTRNPLHERVFVTSSPVYEETLPTIANPPSLRQEEGRRLVWTVTKPEDFARDHQEDRLIRSYGIDKVMQHSHEVTWRDEGDCNTLKLRASPQKGGDAMLQWYVRAQAAIGWLQGVYTDYRDYCTLGPNWSPDHVVRQPDGEWLRAWSRTYALKPAKAVEFDEHYAQRIKEKYGVAMSYTDVLSCASPWDYCDYDARVPGAGTFAATYYAYGQILLNDQAVYGPTQSEGTYQWLYAGLESGSYGWVYTDVNLLTHPLDVAFMLDKIHPLECNYGMGSTYLYLSQIDPQWRVSPRRREYVDLFLATTIAYGNMGWLIREFGLTEPFGLEAMARSYYMMQQLQQQYAFVRPRTIQYADRSGKLVSASAAHASGILADSRLRVVYDNGTEVYVNRGRSGAWRVQDPRGRAVELPACGWLAFNRASGFYEMSALEGGRRVDYVRAPEYEFVDGRGQWTVLGRLGAAGAAALRGKPGDVRELIDIYGNDRLAFQAAVAGVLMAYDADGRNLGRVATTAPRAGWYEFRTLPGARRYLFAPEP